jgi:quercetin dioxygenase-like cupin family protein
MGHPEKPKEENDVKKSLIVSGVGVLIIAVAAGVVQAQKGAVGHKVKHVIYAQSKSATYTPMPQGKVSMAKIWGDPDQGAHATYTKFDPGFDAGMHTHTNDVWIVVLKGAYLYKDDAGEKRVGPGDFLRVPGGHKHWSGGDKTEGALFYEEGSGKFDNIPAK